MFYLRAFLAALGFAAASVYGIAIALLRRDRSLVARDYGRALARTVQPLIGMRMVLHGEENLYRDRPCIYICNHQSAFDVPLLGGVYPSGTVIIAKKEISDVPLFGWIFEATGNIRIDRADRGQSVGRLREAEEAIRTRRVSVWIFPEGTRGKEPGKLLPFKRGAFHMAVATGAPLVPIVVAPLQERYNVKRRLIRPGTVEIKVLEPIPTAALRQEDVPALLEEAQLRMGAALARLHERLLTP